MTARMSLLALCLSWSPLGAGLPMVHNHEWIGYFAIHEGNRYDYFMRRTGEMILVPKQRDRQHVALNNQIQIDYGIEELKPDGVTVLKKTRSLSSQDAATDDIRKLVIRGKATGDAEFELVIEQSRDVISVGGRVVDAGELTEFPLRFVVRVSIPNVYRRVEIEDKGEQREFEKKTRRDYMELKRIDHSRVMLTQDDDEPMDAAALTGAGIDEIEMRLSYYEGRRFHFAACGHSGMAITSGRATGPWYEGMVLQWVADGSKDPEGRARLSLWVK